MGEILSYLSSAYGYFEDYDTQLTLLERAHKIIVKKYEPNNIEIARVMVRLGNAHAQKRDPEKQFNFLKQALPIYERHLGEKHPEVGMILNFIGYACRGIGEKSGKEGYYHKAKKYVERSLDIMREYYGEHSIQYAQVLTNRGLVCGKLNDCAKMKEYLEQALQLTGETFGESHFEHASLKVKLSKASRGLGDISKATTLLHESIQVLSKLNNTPESIYLEALTELYGHENNSSSSNNECDIRICKELLIFRLKHLDKSNEKIIQLQKKIIELEGNKKWPIAVSQYIFVP
jgi:tetratricopeptide (TPR) repeat protein